MIVLIIVQDIFFHWHFITFQIKRIVHGPIADFCCDFWADLREKHQNKDWKKFDLLIYLTDLWRKLPKGHLSDLKSAMIVNYKVQNTSKFTLKNTPKYFYLLQNRTGKWTKIKFCILHFVIKISSGTSTSGLSLLYQTVYLMTQDSNSWITFCRYANNLNQILIQTQAFHSQEFGGLN